MKSPSLSDLILPVAVRFRTLALVIFLAALVLAYGVTRLRIENDIMFMLPDSNTEKNFFMDTQERFGSTTGIVVSVSAPETLYDPLLLEKIREAGDRILRANLSIPAGEMEKRLPLEKSQALMVTAFLQNFMRMEGSDAIPEADFFAQEDLLEEGLAEALPLYLASGISEAEIRETAALLARTSAGDPGLGAALMAIVAQPTDNRGFNRGVWVDQISSLMESDSVWPEFSAPEELDAFFAAQGLTDPAPARRFAARILELGLTRPEAVSAWIRSPAAIRDGDLPESFLEKLREILSENPSFAASLLEEIQRSTRQIRTGKLFTPGEGSLADLRHRLKGWSLFEKTLYSPDGKSTLIFIRTAPNLNKANKARLLEEVRTTLAEVFRDSGLTCRIAGEAVVDNEIGTLMVQDIQRLFPVVTCVVMLCLFLMFRNLPGVIYPILTVLLSLVACFGIMGYAGVPVSIVSSALPVLLVAVGTAYAIHLTHAFQQHGTDAASPLSRARKVLNLTGGGVLMAGLTTVAGFGSLAANRIVPLRDFGIFISLGVVFALLLSLLLIPALMLRFGGKAAQDPPETPPGTGTPSAMALFCCRHPKTVSLISLAVFLISLAGLFQLRVEMNNITFFKAHAPIRVADTFINRHFAGTTGLTLVFSGQDPGDALNPDAVALMERLGRHLESRHPEIGKVISPADMVKKMNQAFFDNDPDRYRLPRETDLSGERSPQALQAQYEAYMDKYQRKDTRSLLDPTKKEAAMNIQMKTASSTAVSAVSRSIRDFLDGPEGQPLRDRGIRTRITGPGTLYLEANQLIVAGQLWSIALSLVLVFMVVTWMMRSLLYGLFSLIPLGLTIMVTFGIMGFAAIPLDVATAITACVAIGIGIDYGIHYLVHYRDARSRGYSPEAAVLHTAAGTGRAILFNASAVTAGFIVLLASAFIPLIHLGFLISITMVTSALAAMTLLPAVLILAEKTGRNLSGNRSVTHEIPPETLPESSLTSRKGEKSHAA